jgi:parallel beta-helix repeat protein
MKSIAALFVAVVLFACFTFPLPVKAESRTYIVPDDYGTIQEAVDAANSDDTVYVRSGSYVGIVEINKSIALIGEDNKAIIRSWTITGQAAILITHSNVTVSGMTIDNPIYTTQWTKKRGIHLLNVENCLITHNIVRHCDSGTAQGIWLYQSQNNIIAHNTVEDCNFGIDISSSNNNQIINNTLWRNDEAIYVEESNQNIVTQNTLTECTIGLQLTNADYNTFADNNISSPMGIRFATDYDVYSTHINGDVFVHNNFFQATGYPYVHVGNVILGATYYETDYTVTGTSYFDNGVEGNYYARYSGADLNHDGIGDHGYGLSITDNFSDNYPLMAPWAGDKRPPIIEVFSPNPNITVTTRELLLNFTVNEATSQINYSLDGAANVTITANTTIPLDGFYNGDHNIVVYAADLAGNQAAPKMVHFTLAMPQTWDSISIPIVIGSILAAVAIVVLLFLRRKPVHKP